MVIMLFHIKSIDRYITDCKSVLRFYCQYVITCYFHVMLIVRLLVAKLYYCIFVLQIKKKEKRNKNI